MKPKLYVFAGPNGSGKSTLYENVLAGTTLKGIEYVNPDEYAKKHGSEVKGGRKAIQRRNELLKSGTSFVTETTLAGNSALKLMKTAKDAGYKITLYYIGTDNSKVNIRSVKDRVAKGGHDVPREAIVRRHTESLKNLPEAIKLANKTHVFHRGSKNIRRVFSAINGMVRPRKDVKPPQWVPDKLRTRINVRTQTKARSR